MKKTLFIVLAIALCVGMTAIAMAGVSNTPHDPRVNPGLPTATHVCESCHTPHSAGTYPLWNRDRDHATTAFTIYASPTQDMPTSSTDLGYQSRLCFACHDGLLATITNAPGQDLAGDYDIQIVDPTKILDTTLNNDHPVGFVFNASQDTGGSGISGLTVVNSKITVAGVANFPLFTVGINANTFQCATCHTVHHTPDTSYSTVNEVYFLRVGNAGSAMCAACHPTFY
jgi:hypothetical protein